MKFVGRFIPLNNGNLVQVNSDETVVSVQPNGSIESRPKGASGPYEQCRREGLLVFYQPEFPSGAQYIFSLIDFL